MLKKSEMKILPLASVKPICSPERIVYHTVRENALRCVISKGFARIATIASIMRVPCSYLIKGKKKVECRKKNILQSEWKGRT